MQSLRLVFAAPFLIVASVAYLLMGLQLALAIINFLGGVSLIDALVGWALSTAFFGIVGTVAGVVGMIIGGVGVFASSMPPEPVRRPRADVIDDAGSESVAGDKADRISPGDQLIIRIDTMLPARHPDGWQFLQVAAGTTGIVVAEDATGWSNESQAELPSGGLTGPDTGAVSTWIDGKEFAVPRAMLTAGHVEVRKR